MATITITESAGSYPYFTEECRPNVRWAGPGLLEQLWLVIEYQGGYAIGQREEWREVPNSPTFGHGQ